MCTVLVNNAELCFSEHDIFARERKYRSWRLQMESIKRKMDGKLKILIEKSLNRLYKPAKKIRRHCLMDRERL